MDKVVSFDIWDTILKRKCHPEEIKLYTAKYIWLKYNDKLKDEYKDIYSILLERNAIEGEIAKENTTAGKDNEYTASEVFVRLQSRIFMEELDIAEELVAKEIEQEKLAVYVNPDIIPIFEKYKDNKKYCISDFYLDAPALEDILKHADVPADFVKIYSSCDYLLNKKSGRLYKQFESDVDISPENHIHVGDNPYSDIEAAEKLGIETINIENIPRFSFECKKNRKFDFNLLSLSKEAGSKENKLYNIGLNLSPMLYFFVQSIIEYAVLNKIPKVYYATREGETFIKIHEMIKNNNPYNMELSECEIIEVSRMATFPASLNEFSITELLRLWSQYRVQSMKTLFKTLNIDITKYIEYFNKYDIDIKEKISEPWFNIQVQKLFMDKQFLSLINKELADKKEELLKYMANHNITNNAEPLFMVDIGWRGTIQDNLAYIFDEKQISGYYYALFDFYNLQPKNTRKEVFVKNRDVLLKDVAPMITLLEMLFNPQSGSVIRYKDGQAIRKTKDEELKVVKELTSHIQEGMLSGCGLLNEYFKLHPYQSEEFMDYIYSQLQALRTNPPEELTFVYYSLIHNDTFGTGNYVDKHLSLSFWDKLNVFKCRRLLLKEEWKEAFMVYNKIYLLQFILDIKKLLRRIIRK